MTAQLISAMSSTDPAEVAFVRSTLVVAGELAVDADSPRCVVYAGLTCALKRPSRDVDSMLAGAVLTATGFDPGVVELVAVELLEASTAPGAAVVLLVALVRELRMAAAAVAVDIHNFGEELRRTDSPGDIP